MFRIGKFYPNLTSDFVMAECPEFWRSHKIKINLLNMKDEDYMDNIQISAYVAIALDLLVGIGSFWIVWRFSKMSLIYKNSGWSLFGCTPGRHAIVFTGGPNGTLRLFSLLSLPMMANGLVGRDSGLPTLPYYSEVEENISVRPVGPFKLFGRMKFILFKIILAFGMPLVDTITGKGKLFWKLSKLSHNLTDAI